MAFALTLLIVLAVLFGGAVLGGFALGLGLGAGVQALLA